MNKDIAKPSTDVAALNSEIAALAKRLADLEENLPARRFAHPPARKRKSTAILTSFVVISLALVFVIWENTSPVHSQNAARDSLTIDLKGNVGIGTTNPGAMLDVNGEVRARTASILETVKFSDGTTQSTAAPPAGAVIAFNRSNCPAGWSEYAPARGRFIRGIDKSGQTDPSGTRNPGNTQEDAIRNIIGSITGVKGQGARAWDWGFRPGRSGAFEVPFNLTKYNPYGGGEYEPEGGVGWSASFDASRVVPTAPENRPKNVALLYCEKN
jgi:hypothetical protein